MRNYFKISTICQLLIFQLISINASAQFFDFPSEVIDKANLMVTYNLSYKQDTNRLDFQRQEEMLLFVGEKTSLFISKNLYNLRQLGTIAEREGRLDSFIDEMSEGHYRARFLYSIYKNYPQGKLTYADKVLPTFFIYEVDLSAFQWELLDKDSLINGYTVQKARLSYGGRLWSAWYTLEIPVADGPYKFSGLPGLILKVSDSQGHYVFEMTAIERLKEAVAIAFYDMGWVKTDRKGVLSAEENFRHDIINRAREAGANLKSQQTAARNMLKRNNPIELE
ncbi:MAG: GLPGLI family protein [Bacteroidales bacterium]|jgi:GLPGLI family protein|nr:GLPGLI family protein [Bacteroidales bacterium]